MKKNILIDMLKISIVYLCLVFVGVIFPLLLGIGGTLGENILLFENLAYYISAIFGIYKILTMLNDKFKDLTSNYEKKRDFAIYFILSLLIVSLIMGIILLFSYNNQYLLVLSIILRRYLLLILISLVMNLIFKNERFFRKTSAITVSLAIFILMEDIGSFIKNFRFTIDIIKESLSKDTASAIAIIGGADSATSILIKGSHNNILALYIIGAIVLTYLLYRNIIKR